jgi:hypothetical protein
MCRPRLVTEADFDLIAAPALRAESVSGHGEIGAGCVDTDGSV